MSNSLKRLTLTLVFMLAACAPINNGPVEHEQSYLLITNVQLIGFESDTPEITQNASVLIRGKNIQAVDTTGTLETPKNTKVIDAQGRSLLPGLVDMHVHLWDEAELGAYLARGITTVRNASGMPFHLTLAERVRSGSLAGPTILTTGPILNGNGPNTQINHQLVSNGEEARRAVREQHRAGYRHLKVYSNLSRPSYTAIREEAEVLGMTIMGHSPEGVREVGIPKERPFKISFKELIDDNFISFEHMETIVWHGLYDDLNIDKARQLARQLANSGASVDATLLAYRNLLNVAKSRGGYLERPGTELLNPFINETEQDNFLFWAEQPAGRLEAFDAFYLKALKIFHEEGVTLVTGTDAGIFTNIPGISLVEELKLFVEAGLTPFDALQAATYNAAKTLRQEHRIGKIKPGYVADLVLVPNQILEDVQLLMRPVAVIKNGVFYDQSALIDLLSSAEKTSYERTEANILTGLEAQGSSF